jgi:hypothetical protein
LINSVRKAGSRAPRHALHSRPRPHANHIEAGEQTPGARTRMNTLISILITFLVVILVLYLVNMLPLDSRAKQIVRVIVIVIGVLSLLRYLAVF